MNESGSICLISFKGPLNFYKNINDGYTTLEKTEENNKKN